MQNSVVVLHTLCQLYLWLYWQCCTGAIIFFKEWLNKVETWLYPCKYVTSKYPLNWASELGWMSQALPLVWTQMAWNDLETSGNNLQENEQIYTAVWAQQWLKIKQSFCWLLEVVVVIVSTQPAPYNFTHSALVRGGLLCQFTPTVCRKLEAFFMKCGKPDSEEKKRHNQRDFSLQSSSQAVTNCKSDF